MDLDEHRLFKDLYECKRKGEEAEVIRRYERMSREPSSSMTVCDDTILHMAINMGNESIARGILEKLKDRETLTKQNVFQDTVLHEAASANMTELAKELLEKKPELLSMPNKYGETPLFKAAQFGRGEMFELLADKVENANRDEAKKHLSREDKTTVLHMTVLAEFFDMAYMIAKKYPALVDEKDGKGVIALQLLSSNPSAFKSGSSYGLLKNFIYYCVPDKDAESKDSIHEVLDEDAKSIDSSDEEDKDKDGDKARGSKLPQTLKVFVEFYFMIIQIISSVVKKMNRSLWSLFRKGWPMMKKIREEKRKHDSALRLAKLLIAKDTSWEHTSTEELDEEGEEIRGAKSKKNGGGEGKSRANEAGSAPTLTSLLLATSNGIVEIVEEILHVFPQAIEHVSHKKQNILHVAIKYRQKKIFNKVTKMKIPMIRLVRQIDSYDFTLLHYVGVMGYYSGGTLPGPALQLQEELNWFERVREIVPPYYAMHSSEKGMTAEGLFEKTHPKLIEEAQEWLKRTSEKGVTAEGLFEITHTKLLEEAQEWLKRTSESCSTVAVLIATVAFAAAYTVPGGSNQDTGLPVLLHDPVFLVFTVMDVLSLASSLTSVVMFLSILTSPFQLQDFRHSLPRKLILGFSSLFFSVAVMMLTFTATILLIVHLKKRWTTLLIYTIAFLPVSIFAILQFPLYSTVSYTLKSSFKLICVAFPCNAIRSVRTTPSSISKRR